MIHTMRIIIQRVASLFILTTLAAGLFPGAVKAQTTAFDYNNILPDSELIAYQTMSALDIQRFLEHKGSYLANFFISLDTGERISAAEHIFRVAQTHRVNPRFLLALMQKEQSLVETPTPQPRQLDWAMGYGCFDNQPCNERWRGFHKQVNSAAEQFRYYFDNIHEYPYRPGKSVTIDSTLVTPKNTLTAALYNYTPHLHGNLLMRQIWDRYFQTQLPDGTLVQVPGDSGVWLLVDGVRRAFTSYPALVTRYNPSLIVPIGQTDLDQYPRGIDIEFAAYALVRGNPSGSTYLLTVDAKRLISSPDVFKNLGFNPEEVEDVDDQDLVGIPNGKPITLSEAHPTGALLEEKTTRTVYYVESGRKYLLRGREIAKINFPALTITPVASDVLSKYQSGLPVIIKDGALVKGSGPEVYVISDGARRHIPSEGIFNSIGYKWSNVVAVSDDVLALHPVGEAIALD